MSDPLERLREIDKHNRDLDAKLKQIHDDDMRILARVPLVCLIVVCVAILILAVSLFGGGQPWGTP